jgi:hypothetical protein
MHPLILVCLAPVLLLFSAVVYYGSQGDEAAKAVARARPAPAAVRIEDFKAARDTGAAGEVVILAQVDLSRLGDLVFSKNGDERDRYVLAPLYPVSARDFSGPAYGIITERDQLTNAQIKGLIAGDGLAGPILRLDGELLPYAMVRKAIESEFGQNLTVTKGAVYIDPYVKGRAAALAPSNSGREAAYFIAALSLFLALLGGFLQWRRVKRDRAETDGYYGSSY